MKRVMGSGCVVKLRQKDEHGNVKESRYWYILYRTNGRQIRESTKSESKMVAYGLLRRRLAEVSTKQSTRFSTDSEGAALLFTEQEIKVLIGPCVYVFYQGNLCLYVGKGVSSGRPLSNSHHKRADLAQADKLLIYPCPSPAVATEMETRLIAAFNPILNQTRPAVKIFRL